MTQSHIIIRSEMSKTSGGGHVLRCGFLTQDIDTDRYAITWAASEETFALKPALKEKFRTVVLDEGNSPLEDMRQVHQALGYSALQMPTIIFDGYHMGKEHTEAAARYFGYDASIRIFIDEKCNRSLGAVDLLVDFLPHQAADYKGIVGEDTRILSGPHYQMMPESFLAHKTARAHWLAAQRPQDAKKRVLIMNGGMNIGGMLEMLAETLGNQADQWQDCRFDIFTMDKAHSAQEIKAAAEDAQAKGVDITAHLGPWNGVKEMETTDLYIGAAGLTPYELGAIGECPSVVMAAGHNQNDIAALTHAKGAGIDAGEYLHFDSNGDIVMTGGKDAVVKALNEARHLLDDPDRWEAMRVASSQFCDTKGAQRVAQAITDIHQRKMVLSPQIYTQAAPSPFL